MLLGSGLLPQLGMAGGGGLTGATWAVDGSGRAYNTPTLGSELLTDGGLESTYTAGLCGPLYKNGSPSVVDETVNMRSGSHAQKFTATANGDRLNKFATTAVGQWYLAGVWNRRIAGTTGSTYFRAINTSVYTSQPFTSSEYSFYPISFRSVNAGSSATVIYSHYELGLSSFDTTISDDMTLKQITTSTLLATTGGTANQTPLAKINAITTSTQAGVIGWLDNPASPANFVIAIRDGSGRVNLTKCVAGVYTNLISISSAFVADAAIEIRRPSGNTFQLWYNGSKIGTDQTISDAAIADNATPHYGLFSTYSGNTFSEFRLDGNIVPFGF